MRHPNKKQDKRGTCSIAPCLAGAVLGVLLCLLVMSICRAGEAHVDEEVLYLKRLSIEDLLELEVTSVSKKREKLSEAAAAVFVITREDIRRSGATSIPEALRMAPGLQVARIDASKWAITSRGFNHRLANKLLVLIDGRTVYTPLYSGVFWDIQDTLLEDIDRIEVIRGPGATLWGANAVNGVINIITRAAKETQGGLVSAGAGTEERGFGAIRYGAKLGNNAHYRVYAKYVNRDDSVYASGEDATDNWDISQGGFRIDWQASERNSLTLQGDIYEGDTGQTISFATLTDPYMISFSEDSETAGRNILMRWRRAFSESSELVFHAYYDYSERKEELGRLFHDIFEVDLQHRFALSDRQELLWGLGYRTIHDDINGLVSFKVDPERRESDLFSAFVQDKIMLIKDRLCLTLGSKFEHNDYTGSEIQPGARLLWTPDEDHSVWMSVARAVRTPSRVEQDVMLTLQAIPPGVPENPSPLPFLISLRGNEDFESEALLAWEIGYRVRPVDTVSVDIAAFLNKYDNLRTIEPGLPYLETVTDPVHFTGPLFIDNKMDGDTYGVELVAAWQVSEWWCIRSTYTFLKMQLHMDRDSLDTSSEGAEGESPDHQFSLQSSMDLPGHLEFDVWCQYTDNLPTMEVGSYVSLDARLAWRPLEDFELSIVGQNLLDSHHPEFLPEFLDISPTEVERSLYGKITWHF
ncbi:MAG: TonB-dependent receptor [Thermodesulfobacteriota bacterium]|nr:TonB-dependent receptor [Thermodesulfobacteriota bacterium]